ncbi:Cytochrome bd ubiquinol oxidase, subunit I, partial [Candidatus Thiomargarita nelsonii]
MQQKLTVKWVGIFALFAIVGLSSNPPMNLLPQVAAAELAMDSESIVERIQPIGRVRLAGEPEPEISVSNLPQSEEKALIPAPQVKRSEYPNMGFSSRSFVWIIAQLHLFFAAFVLAVPLFVLVIELIGHKTGDQRYDDMAHEFMKISMTAYSITALFGGTLAFALFLLYPQLMAYLMRVFNAQTLVYAALF